MKYKIVIISLLIVVLCTMSFVCAFAQTEDCAGNCKVYNFNQLINPTNYIGNYEKDGISYTFDNLGTINIKGKINNPKGTYCNVLKHRIVMQRAHKYYISTYHHGFGGWQSLIPYCRLYRGNDFVSDNAIGGGIIVENNNSTPSLSLIYQTREMGIDIDYVCTPILIDLTQMFGFGNEPNSVTELLNILPDFVYFPYTESTLIGGDNIQSQLNAYNRGFNDAVKDYTFKLDTNLLVSNTKAYDYQGAEGYVTTTGSSNIFIGTGLVVTTLNTKLKQGTPVTIKSKVKDENCISWFTPDSELLGKKATNVMLGIFEDNGVFTPVKTFTKDDITEFSSYTFIMPKDSKNIAWFTGTNNTINFIDGQILYSTNDFQAQMDNSYQSGYEIGFNSGKSQGYDEGFRKGQSGDYTFLGLMTSVIDAPIKSMISVFDFEILGTNMKQFFLSLFTALVIICIIRFAFKFGG